MRRRSVLAAEALRLQQAREGVDKAGITIIFQRSWMNRNDRCAGHHLFDLQGQQRRVRVLLYAAGALTSSIARRRWIWII
jgi:hypothetical protein